MSIHAKLVMLSSCFVGRYGKEEMIGKTE